MFISLLYAEVTDELRLNELTSGALFVELIRRLYGRQASKVEQSISGVLIYGDLVKTLKVPNDSPGLCIQRWWKGRDDEIYMYARSTYNGLEYTHKTTVLIED